LFDNNRRRRVTNYDSGCLIRKEQLTDARSPNDFREAD